MRILVRSAWVAWASASRPKGYFRFHAKAAARHGLGRIAPGRPTRRWWSRQLDRLSRPFSGRSGGSDCAWRIAHEMVLRVLFNSRSTRRSSSLPRGPIARAEVADSPAVEDPLPQRDVVRYHPLVPRVRRAAPVKARLTWHGCRLVRGEAVTLGLEQAECGPDRV
jgi:hypothetical protein